LLVRPSACFCVRVSERLWSSPTRPMRPGGVDPRPATGTGLDPPSA
jgi:hypothetical protein